MDWRSPGRRAREIDGDIVEWTFPTHKFLLMASMGGVQHFTFCWKCLKRCHWSTIPKIHFIRFLQHICQSVIFMYIIIVIIIDSACLLRALEDKLKFLFFWHGFSMANPGIFLWHPHGVDLLLTPRNLPGFSGDCVCPETLPDWCSRGMDLPPVYLRDGPQGLPVAIKGVVIFGEKKSWAKMEYSILVTSQHPKGQDPKFAQWKGGQGSKHWKFLLFLKLWGVDLWF